MTLSKGKQRVDAGGKEIDKPSVPMMQSPQTQDEVRNWIPAIPERYHPNLWESTAHLFGKHIFPEFSENIPHGVPQCLICYKYKNL